MAVLEIPLQNIFFTVKNVLVVSFIYDQQAAFPYEFPEFSERFQLAWFRELPAHEWAGVTKENLHLHGLVVR